MQRFDNKAMGQFVLWHDTAFSTTGLTSSDWKQKNKSALWTWNLTIHWLYSTNPAEDRAKCHTCLTFGSMLYRNWCKMVSEMSDHISTGRMGNFIFRPVDWWFYPQRLVRRVRRETGIWMKNELYLLVNILHVMQVQDRFAEDGNTYHWCFHTGGETLTLVISVWGRYH